jgi:hypothetical protein
MQVHPKGTDASAMIEQRIAALRAAPAYAKFLRVREEVVRMLEAQRAADQSPSDYWVEELEGFDYMLDASPLIISKLRQHMYHVTGLRHHDYRSHRPRQVERYASKLEALKAVGDPALLVAEPAALGGFGHEIDGQLINLDTLKFFEALIALDRGAVLGELRGASRRPVVWEIGGGWGGFAYQMKTLFPDLTYVISDLPELYLFSASYLMTMFPSAKVAFVADAGDMRAVGNWSELDFIFTAHTTLEELDPPYVDLALNMVSFQEMTDKQVEAYARRARELGARYLYSFNRDRGPYNPQITSVRAMLDRHFWLHPVTVLPEPYTELRMRDKKKPREVGEFDYRHVIGWPRLDGADQRPGAA